MKSHPPEHDEAEDVKRDLMIPYIVIGVLVWGSLIAMGSYAFRGEHDYRKPLIVMACVGTFVGIWGLALWFNRGRLLRGFRSRDDK